MPGVSFNSHPGGGPSDDPSQDAYTLVVILSSSENSSNIDVKFGLNLILDEIQVFTAAEDSEVVDWSLLIFIIYIIYIYNIYLIL